MNSIAFGIVSNATIYVAVGDGGNIFTSPDIVTWTAAASPTGNNLYNVSFPNGSFVATGGKRDVVVQVRTRSRGPSQFDTGQHPSPLRGATFGAGSYAVVGDCRHDSD